MCRKNQKIAGCQRISEAVSNVAQTKALSFAKTVASVSGTADIQGAAAVPDVSEYLNFEPGKTDSGGTDDAKRCNGFESEGPKTDGTGVKQVLDSQTVAATVASSSIDSSSPNSTPAESNSADKVEWLRRLIDRAAGQLYTIAEVYLMMMKPARVPLEYDWVETASTSTAATEDVSSRLSKLVHIAKAVFTANTAKHMASLRSTSD